MWHLVASSLRLFTLLRSPVLEGSFFLRKGPAKKLTVVFLLKVQSDPFYDQVSLLLFFSCVLLFLYLFLLRLQRELDFWHACSQKPILKRGFWQLVSFNSIWQFSSIAVSLGMTIRIIETSGQLFKRSLASVKQNPVLSHFQFTWHFYPNTIYREKFRESIRLRLDKHLL